MTTVTTDKIKDVSSVRSIYLTLVFVMKNISLSTLTVVHLITVKLSAINIAFCSSVTYTRLHSKLIIALCK